MGAVGQLKTSKAYTLTIGANAKEMILPTNTKADISIKKGSDKTITRITEDFTILPIFEDGGA